MITGNRTVVNIGADDLAWAGYTRVADIIQEIRTKPRRLLGGGDVRPMMGGDDHSPGVVLMDILFDPREELPKPSAPDRATNSYAMIITYQEIEGNAATLQGSGFLTSRSYPRLLNDLLAIARIAFQFDGYSGPNFIKEQ